MFWFGRGAEGGEEEGEGKKRLYTFLMVWKSNPKVMFLPLGGECIQS